MDSRQTPTQKQNITLDRKSKVLFAVFALLIASSVAVTFWRYVVKRDYIIEAQIDCDPETENCFIWRCDPNSLEESEKCTGNPDNDIWYYKILRRNAKYIPLCDPKDENCTAYVCGEGEKDCGYDLCTPENAKKGEECNDPAKYLEQNPPEEESEECSPDDENCSVAADTDQPDQSAQ
jgi:hypothetical protein